MKGVSPIIATLLILLIAVSLGGSFWVFSQRTFSEVSETTEGEIGRSGQALSSSIKIESVATNSTGSYVFVRNSGSRNIESTRFAVFVEGQIVTVDSATPAIITPDAIATVQTTVQDSLCNGRRSLKVSAGTAEDSTLVNIGPTGPGLRCRLTLA